MNIIGLFPLTGNGGIASWTRKFRETFPDEEFHFEYINVSSNISVRKKYRVARFIVGLYGLLKVAMKVRMAIGKKNFDILHTTTSGDIGHLRDYFVAKICHRHHVKCIMHCRYGCIPEDIKRNDFVGRILRKAMREFDQIWVLDKKSFNALNGTPRLNGKVYLTPNSIDVDVKIDATPKQYKTVAYCGNVYITKGVLDLVAGAIQTEATLHIIGPASEEMISRIKEVAGDSIGKQVILHGRLPNKEAVEYLKSVDIIALPTYYRGEAFPISIIEAMSLTKLVISCDRAAISDMLTALDGSMCGILVEPQSAEAIANAIVWCQNHKDEADKMCLAAYKKVYESYRKEVVYDIYRRNYRELYGK